MVEPYCVACASDLRVPPQLAYGGRRTDRQTVLDWDANPHTPRLYFKPAPPLHHALHPPTRHNDFILGLHRLITGMEKVLRLTR